MEKPKSLNIVEALSRAKQRGEGMTEYIIIVAVIAIAAIGVYSFFGQTVRQQTVGMAQELSDKTADTQIQGARTAAAASTDASKQKAVGTVNKWRLPGT